MRQALILLFFIPFCCWGENIKSFTSKPYCFYKKENCLNLQKKFQGTKVPNARYQARCVRRAHPDCPGRKWLLYVTIQVSLEKTLSP